MSDLIKAKTFQIHRPSTPKHLKITQTMMEDFIIDPAMGVKVLLNAELDAFQKARLKQSWWAPRTLDSSGFSSAKTLNLWLVSVLRSMLVPDHHAGIYYPVFSTGQQTYWQYFNKFQGMSKIFRAQLGEMDVEKTKVEGKSTRKGQSCWTCHFKNESLIMMPAASFIQDARTQASIRLNFLGIDEWTKIMAGGSSGIDDQLIGRVTRESFNKDHPFWCNHHLFLATAEDAMHPGYERYRHFKEQIDRGNPDYVMLAYSFKDYSTLHYKNGRSFRDVFREDKVLKDMKAAKSAAGYRQEGLGVWSETGKGWYTTEMVDAARDLGISMAATPITSRDEDPAKFENPHFFLGADPARAETKKADDGALVVLRAAPMGDPESQNLRDWKLNWSWAYKVRRADGPQWSGIIHRKHQHFNFTRIMMDPGGGGSWIQPELARTEQVIRGEKTEVMPIATIEDEATTMVLGQFILSMFRPRDKRIEEAWDKNRLRSMENLIDIAHSELRDAMEQIAIGFPQRFADRPKDEVKVWSDEKKWANRLIDNLGAQLQRVNVQTNDDGSTYFNKNNARIFGSKGRKDFAYAALYAFSAFICWLKGTNRDFAVADEDEAMCA